MTENTSRPGEDRRPHNQHSALANALGDTIANDMRQAAMTNAALAGNIEDHDHNIIDGILRRASKAKNKLADIIGGRVSTPETQPTPKSSVPSDLDSRVRFGILTGNRADYPGEDRRDPRETESSPTRPGEDRRDPRETESSPTRPGEGQMLLPFRGRSAVSVSRKAATGRLPRNESKSRLDTLKYILEISNKRSDTKKTKGNLDNASTKKSNRISNASSY